MGLTSPTAAPRQPGIQRDRARCPGQWAAALLSQQSQPARNSCRNTQFSKAGASSRGPEPADREVRGTERGAAAQRSSRRLPWSPLAVPDLPPKTWHWHRIRQISSVQVRHVMNSTRGALHFHFLMKKMGRGGRGKRAMQKYGSL